MDNVYVPYIPPGGLKKLQLLNKLVSKEALINSARANFPADAEDELFSGSLNIKGFSADRWRDLWMTKKDITMIMVMVMSMRTLTILKMQSRTATGIHIRRQKQC